MQLSEQRRQHARTPKEVNFEGDKSYEMKHRIASQYPVSLARRQLVTGMNIRVADPGSSKQYLSLENFKKLSKKTEPPSNEN